ncbi:MULTISPECIES: transketolase [unclassified Spiroplasma]|uniref:transketolase n=1 Tax=unclassified Spiroplasma TaxID=2637901 RepID=UPI00313AB98A
MSQNQFQNENDDYNREQSINTIKMLGVEAVNQANSGHPGIVLGAAPMSYALFSEHLYCNPQDPQWINRDRFILSAGHGSALLYALLHLSGYDISIDEVKNFRQLDSITPGHPERNLTPGVEATTGPLGQGLAMGVGCDLVRTFLAHKYNKPDFNIFDYHTYIICSDGDLQEGISQEAISLAGHLKLSNLIVLYDSNDIQLDGPVSLSQSENTKQRFLSANWNYILVTAGSDFKAISQAIRQAKAETEKPTLIEIKTIIGVGASKAGTSSVHGAPLGDDIIKLKENLKWDYEPFFVPDDVKNDFKVRVAQRGQQQQQIWNQMWTEYANKYVTEYKEINDTLYHNYNFTANDFQDILIEQDMATRDCSSMVLKTISKKLPLFIGGSADLSSSTKVLGSDGYFASNNLQGRNIMFGVREFGMGAISNGMLLQKTVRSFVATFLIFSDYMKPAIRLASLMEIPNIFVFSHDSIAVGEDGPTHQPVEQISMLRALPNLNVFRPCDMKETIASYICALNSKDKPTAILVSRQNLPQIISSDVNKALKGGYIISPEKSQLELIIIATGSEVQLALKVQQQLQKENINTIRVVSMPSTTVFDCQDVTYKLEVLPQTVKKISLEMASTWGWHKYVDNGITFGIDRFGISASMQDIMNELGFTVDNIVLQVKQLLQKDNIKEKR